jgi:hypothetical protein
MVWDDAKMQIKSKKFVTLISVLIIIVAAAGSITYFEINKKPTISLGPKMRINTFLNSTTNASSNITETIQIFSAMPLRFGSSFSTNINIYNISGLNPYNNTVYIELFNQSYNYIVNNYTVFLSSSFKIVEEQWINYLSSQVGFTEPSLDLIATLTTVENGSVNVYTYYNNILFNPFNITFLNWFGNGTNSWFKGTDINPMQYSEISYSTLYINTNIYFDLKSPTMSDKYLLKTTTNENKKVNPFYFPGHPTGIYYKVVKWTNMTGPLPLIGVHINYPSGQSQLDSGASFITGSATLNMNSNMVIYSTSSESYKDLMSTTPSLSKSAPFTISSNGWNAYPLNFANGNSTETTAITYLSNVTYEIVHYNIYQNIGPYWIYLGNATEVKITNIYTANGFYVNSTWFPITLNDVLTNMSFSSVSVGNLPPMHSLQGYNVWDSEQGYANAASVYKTISNAIDLFSTSLDLGLAIINVLAATSIADLTVPEIVAESIELISAVTALSTKVLSDFSSISFLSSTSITGFGYFISNEPLGNMQGNTFTLSDYQSTNEVSFSGNGQTYYFYAPMNYITAN